MARPLLPGPERDHTRPQAARAQRRRRGGSTARSAPGVVRPVLPRRRAPAPRDSVQRAGDLRRAGSRRRRGTRPRTEDHGVDPDGAGRPRHHLEPRAVARVLRAARRPARPGQRAEPARRIRVLAGRVGRGARPLRAGTRPRDTDGEHRPRCLLYDEHRRDRARPWRAGPRDVVVPGRGAGLAGSG